MAVDKEKAMFLKQFILFSPWCSWLCSSPVVRCWHFPERRKYDVQSNSGFSKDMCAYAPSSSYSFIAHCHSVMLSPHIRRYLCSRHIMYCPLWPYECASSFSLVSLHFYLSSSISTFTKQIMNVILLKHNFLPSNINEYSIAKYYGKYDTPPPDAAFII